MGKVPNFEGFGGCNPTFMYR